jgi:hypothetical protein
MVKDINIYNDRRSQGCTQVGGGTTRLQPPLNSPKLKFKKHTFSRYYDIKSFMWFTPSAKISHWNWLMPRTWESWKIIKFKKKQDFYNIIFKIKYKLYIASWSASPPPPRPRENSGCAPARSMTSHVEITCISWTENNTYKWLRMTIFPYIRVYQHR